MKFSMKMDWIIFFDIVNVIFYCLYSLIGVDKLYKVGICGKGVIIGVVDIGFDYIYLDVCVIVCFFWLMGVRLD